MSGRQLAEYQRAAVDLIFKRLTDDSGSKRFLLADEVGLGKTIVARGVIEKLLENRRRELVVVYLCSNAEIGEQNREKLAPKAARAVRRVTELARTGGESSAGPLKLFAFTPGTSLSLNTGLASERRLLLFLLRRGLRKPTHKKAWRNYFRCGVTADTWLTNTSPRAIREEFFRQVPVELQRAIANRWREPVTLGYDPKPICLADALDSEVAEFASYGEEPPEHVRRRRNQVVAKLRHALQREAVAHLQPDLVILDEVQRFKDVLDQEHDPTSIAAQLFARRRTAVLVLSATPYKLLILRHDEEADGSHYEDFLRTIAFLQRLPAKELPQQLEARLGEFAKRLGEGQFLLQADESLRDLKLKIEDELRKVVCRTERNWYVQDVTKGIEEVFPTKEEEIASGDIADFLRLRRFLLDKAQSSFHITDYWKSAPAVLTFMDGDYAVMKHAREQRSLPKGLIQPESALDRLPSRSHRVRTLLRRFLGEEPADSWKYLWIAPSYRYWSGGLYGESRGPTKFLVFSHWRFVPKAISILMSREVARRIQTRDDSLLPLRFGDKKSFHVFEVCLPSFVLARLVDPARLAAEGLFTTADDLVEIAKKRLRKLLEDSSVSIAETGQHSTWQALARIEGASQEDGGIFAHALRRLAGGSELDITESLERHRDDFVEWMKDQQTPLKLSEAKLDRLARTACFSPAVSLVRALSTVYGRHELLAAGLLSVCLGPLRRYFNRPVVQGIIRNAIPEGFYSERVVRYAREAHLQAVLDEFAFLLGDQQPGRPEAALETISRVLGLGQGSPAINTTSPTTDGERLRDTTALPTHIALAFGDQRADNQSADDETQSSRKTSIREAFNSPFWPFVVATTSVGQEGLDFHLYCRDIIHWNLPSNPVDLEQREGRINRRACLAVRSSIAKDWTLHEALARLAMPAGNPWQWVFRAADEQGASMRHKHGLYPYWIYEGSNDAKVPLRRHLVFFRGSSDEARYRLLKEQLSLYRLVFGQPRQADLLETLMKQVQEAELSGLDAIRQQLPNYMINLSPLGIDHARERARQEARQLLAQGAPAVQELVKSIQHMVAQNETSLSGVRIELQDMVNHVIGWKEGQPRSHELVEAVAALAYLRNPYDAEFDFHHGVGFQDDIQEIRRVHHEVFKRQ
jgi:uncharacterized membrane protein YkvA (DUF1232 family)